MRLSGAGQCPQHMAPSRDPCLPVSVLCSTCQTALIDAICSTFLSWMEADENSHPNRRCYQLRDSRHLPRSLLHWQFPPPRRTPAAGCKNSSPLCFSVKANSSHHRFEVYLPCCMFSRSATISGTPTKRVLRPERLMRPLLQGGPSRDGTWPSQEPSAAQDITLCFQFDVPEALCRLWCNLSMHL